VPAFVSIDEMLQAKRHIAGLQIATPAQFLGDVRRYVLRPFLNGVEGDDALRALVLAGQLAPRSSTTRYTLWSSSRDHRGRPTGLTHHNLRPAEPGFKPIAEIRSCRWNELFSSVLVSKGVCPMSYSLPCRLLLVAVLLSPMSALSQGGGGGGGGSAGGASAGGASGSGMAGAAPNAGSAGAGTAAVSGVTGPANVGGLNNSGNDPSGAGNAAKASNTPGTNSAGTANSSGSTSTAGGAPQGSTTVGTAGNPAGGAVGGRIDGTVTPGPAMQGDDTIRAEGSQDSKVDKQIKSICKGC
jgi:hypothetical protein